MSAAPKMRAEPATVLDAALWALDAGLWPVPIIEWDADDENAGKRPSNGRGWGARRLDAAYFRAALAKRPNLGVGLKLGVEGGIIDVDVDDPSAAGPTLARLFPDGLPPTLRWENAPGRIHLIFRYDERLAQLGKTIVDGRVAGYEMYAGVEVRIGAAPGNAQQLQTVCPPSRARDGSPRRWVRWGDILALPENVVADLLEHGKVKPRKAKAAPEPSPFATRAVGGGSVDPWASKALADEAHKVRIAPPKNRNNQINTSAYKLGTIIGAGALDRSTVEAALWGAIEDLGKATDESRRTMRGGLDKGIANPRDTSGVGTKATGIDPSVGHPRGPEATIGVYRGPDDGSGDNGETPPPDDPTTDERPEIRIDTDELAVNDAAIRALCADPGIYSRGPMLVAVRREKRRSKLVNRPNGSPWIAALPKSNLREKMAHHARWTKKKRTPNSKEVKFEPTHPPDWSVAAVWDRGEWDGIRHLEGVAEAPALLADGSLLDTPGYDEASGLIYEPNCDFPPVARVISQADARKAVAELLEVVADFPFAIIGDDGGATHRAAWLASLLTPLARHAIEGPCPLFFIDANTSGAGKSKLVDIVAILTTGRGAARTAFPESDEEMRKQIISIALEGDRLILIDNVTTGAALGGASLDMVLTGTTIKGRVLGRSEMTRELPIYTVWYATGNNLGLRGDMLRRVVPMRLESPYERPEERTDFRIKGSLLKHVEANRGRLTTAALTILRGYFLAGKPQATLTAMDYPEWCGVVRQAVYWASGFDPCGTRRELIEEDPETNQLKAVVNGWDGLPHGRNGLTAALALKILADPEHEKKFEELRSALMEWSRDGDLPGPKTVGRRLKQIKGRVIDGKVMRSKVSGGTQSWYVAPNKSGGFEGFKGFVSPHAGDLSPSTSAEDSGSNLGEAAGSKPLKPLKPTSGDTTDYGDAYEG